MTIDKRINYRFGGAYQGGSGAPGSAEAGKTVGSVGGPSYDSGPSVDYDKGKREFIQNVNNDNFIRANKTGTKFKPYKDPRPQGGGLANLFKGLASMFVPGSSFLFNQGKQGITNIGDVLGNIREDFTGYRTQEEYDNARQQRINLNRIKTLENTIQRKYVDKDRSLDETELDERLAALKSQMGIVPNTAEQNAQQFLDFGNDLAINTEQSIIPNQDITTYMAETNTPFYKPDTGINTLRFVDNNSMSLQPNYLMPNTNKQPILESSPQYASREYPFFPYSGSV